MNRSFSQRPIALILAAVVGVLAVARPAQAAVRPHVSRGTAQFTATGFVGTGNATHLGLYDEAGTIQLSATANPAVFDAIAMSTYTAANGDQLNAVIVGQLNFATGVITATATYVGGTGRFANATGTATLSGQLLPGGSLNVSVKGTINC